MQKMLFLNIILAVLGLYSMYKVAHFIEKDQNIITVFHKNKKLEDKLTSAPKEKLQFLIYFLLFIMVCFLLTLVNL